jgi:hypothetical protein
MTALVLNFPGSSLAEAGQWSANNIGIAINKPELGRVFIVVLPGPAVQAASSVISGG